MVQVQCNVGGVDRKARIGIGTALLGSTVATHMGKPAKIAAGIVGAYSLLTGIIQFCPVSQVFHANTCETAHHPHD